MIKNYLSILAENGEIFLAEIAVAPFVGAWIETTTNFAPLPYFPSLPSWERGLKLLYKELNALFNSVAPFVGAWIETANI